MKNRNIRIAEAKLRRAKRALREALLVSPSKEDYASLKQSSRFVGAPSYGYDGDEYRGLNEGVDHTEDVETINSTIGLLEDLRGEVPDAVIDKATNALYAVFNYLN